MSLFTKDFTEQPYWWEQAPLITQRDGALPANVDVLVIGAGYTGLNAAIQTARAGRKTVVLDAENAGWGASTRNGGQVSTSIKPNIVELQKRYGSSLGDAIYQEGHRSLQWLKDFIQNENIDCDFNVVGHFHAAHNSAQYEKLARALGSQTSTVEQNAYMVSQSDQLAELGTKQYFGGAVFTHHAALHPARYHQALVNKATQAGAQIISHCAALDIVRKVNGFSIKTTNGVIEAEKIVLATNGYTGHLTPWHRKRIIPIGSYIIATERLPVTLMDYLMPKNRTITDTRKIVYYYRSSPDRSSIIFGGRVSFGETNLRNSAVKLHQSLSHIFPELAQTKISHSWMGYVAYTFDELMHMGEEDGLFYAMGYCGSGVGMSSYCGMKLGLQVIGDKKGESAFNQIKFQTKPLYTGNPWFLSSSVMFYKMIDKLNI